MPISCVEIKEQTDCDKNLRDLKMCIKTGWPINAANKDLNIYKKFIPQLSIMKGCILYENRVLIPPNLRSKILDMFHESHPGIVAMKSLVRGVIWYPGIDKDVEDVVKKCTVCQLNRHKPAQTSNVQWPAPKRPWSRVHIDHFFIVTKFS